jgi:hypothetical protein
VTRLKELLRCRTWRTLRSAHCAPRCAAMPPRRSGVPEPACAQHIARWATLVARNECLSHARAGAEARAMRAANPVPHNIAGCRRFRVSSSHRPAFGCHCLPIGCELACSARQLVWCAQALKLGDNRCGCLWLKVVLQPWPGRSACVWGLRPRVNLSNGDHMVRRRDTRQRCFCLALFLLASRSKLPNPENLAHCLSVCPLQVSKCRGGWRVTGANERQRGAAEWQRG